jgi:hypothetical protein
VRGERIGFTAVTQPIVVQVQSGGGFDWSALMGGLIGAGIPAVLAYLGFRRQRQSSDAQAFGPALLLLDELEPMRISINVGTTDVEQQKWEKLRAQSDLARERLLVIAAGHPRKHVRDLAADAAVKVANAYTHSAWQAADMVRHRDNPEWMETAQQTHAGARQALQRLINADFSWWHLW